MPECHRCPYNGKGDPICLTCSGPPETNNKGRSHISMDAGEGAQTLGEVEAALARHGRESGEGEGYDGHDPAEVARAFMALSVEEFGLVRALLAGKTMTKIGRAEGVTKAAISARLKALVERHPVFGFLRRV